MELLASLADHTGTHSLVQLLVGTRDANAVPAGARPGVVHIANDATTELEGAGLQMYYCHASFAWVERRSRLCGDITQDTSLVGGGETVKDSSAAWHAAITIAVASVIGVARKRAVVLGAKGRIHRAGLADEQSFV